MAINFLNSSAEKKNDLIKRKERRERGNKKKSKKEKKIERDFLKVNLSSQQMFKNLNTVIWFLRILNYRVWLLTIIFNNIPGNVKLMCLVKYNNGMSFKKKRQQYP